MQARSGKHGAMLHPRHTGVRPVADRVACCRRGYTLVELLIAMIIMALLAILVVPRLSIAREKAFVATMRSDLRNFAQSQESHFYDHAVYTGALPDLYANGFQISEQIDLVITEATATGWSATAEHDPTGMQCALFVGTAAPVGPATDEGLISCV